jgi:hypothetical protein
MKINRFGYLLILGCLVAGCYSKPKKTIRNLDSEISQKANESIVSSPSIDSITGVEIFENFYYKFLTDSLFQISRIKFPLGGNKYEEDKTLEWSLENWTMIKFSVYEIDTTQYKVEIQDTSSTYRFFRVFIPNSSFDFSMKFNLIDNIWYLIHCEDSI